MCWVQATLSFSIIHATKLCVRGSQIKWMSEVGMGDGAIITLAYFEIYCFIVHNTFLPLLAIFLNVSFLSFTYNCY